MEQSRGLEVPFRTVEIPSQLEKIADQVDEGYRPSTTVRTLLAWFDASRRGFRIVNMIRAALDQSDLETFPDFEGEYVDAPIYFVRKGSLGNGVADDTDDASGTTADTPVPETR